jgi:hypothetical protein
MYIIVQRRRYVRNLGFFSTETQTADTPDWPNEFNGRTATGIVEQLYNSIFVNGVFCVSVRRWTDRHQRSRPSATRVTL